METVKVGIGREIFGENELELLSENNNSDAIESIKNSKIEKEKEWITESIFLAIKKNELIRFEVIENNIFGSIVIEKP